MWLYGSLAIIIGVAALISGIKSLVKKTKDIMVIMYLVCGPIYIASGILSLIFTQLELYFLVLFAVISLVLVFVYVFLKKKEKKLKQEQK